MINRVVERAMRDEGSGPGFGGLAAMLWALSKVYGLVVRARMACFRLGLLQTRRAGLPVISIGNITVGGTGKTPMTMMAARTLREAGHRVCIVSRGYGRRTRGVALVSDGRTVETDAGAFGDEPVMMAARLAGVAVAVSSRRYEGAEFAREKLDAEIVLLDDGYQHVALARDLNILLIDARERFGNGRLLPRGILREPAREIKRADIIILTKVDAPSMTADFEKQLAGLNHEAEIFHASYHPSGLNDIISGEPVAAEAGRGVVAFSGIASPRSFETLIEEAGMILLRHVRFPDHHRYSAEDVRFLSGLAKEEALLVTTEKDAVKVAACDWRDVRVVSLGLEIQLRERARLIGLLDAAARKR